MTLQTLVNKYDGIQKIYNDKLARLSFWEQQFSELEKAVNTLSANFQERYEKSEVPGDLSEEIKAKLENRREGVRLSAKSASRLIRKLNPEKPIIVEEVEFVSEEQLLEKLGEVAGSKLPQEGETLQTFTQKLDSEISASTEEAVKLEESAPDEATEETESQVPLEESIESETETENAEEKLLYVSEATSVLETAIATNEAALEELAENIESTEKRFCSFIEKSLAPVMDGLYSGKKYGESLRNEFTDSASEQADYAKEWLHIYEELLNPMESLFDEFNVSFYIPAVRDLFDEYYHEPIAVVEDTDFENEQVKEVVRYGLKYNDTIYGQENFLIRPAQVIVVKNIAGQQQEIQEATEDGGMVNDEG